MVKSNLWTFPLVNLYAVLRQEAIATMREQGDPAEPGPWAWRRMPRGAIVATRVRGDHWRRIELRIAREGEHTGPNAVKLWEKELEIFFNSMRIHASDGTTVATVPKTFFRWFVDWNAPNSQYIELRHGECRPERSFCSDCGAETSWWEAGGVRGQRCQRCLNLYVARRQKA